MTKLIDKISGETVEIKTWKGSVRLIKEKVIKYHYNCIVYPENGDYYIISKTENPCWGCNNREMECHANCTPYRLWKEYILKTKKSIRKKKWLERL